MSNGRTVAIRIANDGHACLIHTQPRLRSIACRQRASRAAAASTAGPSNGDGRAETTLQVIDLFAVRSINPHLEKLAGYGVSLVDLIPAGNKDGVASMDPKTRTLLQVKMADAAAAEKLSLPSEERNVTVRRLPPPKEELFSGYEAGVTVHTLAWPVVEK
jgi:hypothetical protein